MADAAQNHVLLKVEQLKVQFATDLGDAIVTDEVLSQEFVSAP